MRTWIAGGWPLALSALLVSRVRGAVNVLRPVPDLNTHGPDLGKPVVLDSALVVSYNVSAGQLMIAMCPRGTRNLRT